MQENFKSHRSFQEILEEKLADHQAKPTSQPNESPSSLRSTKFIFEGQWGQTFRRIFQQTFNTSPYHWNQNPTEERQKDQARVQAAYSKQGQLALQFFEYYGETTLAQNPSQKLLKSAYRRVALKIHPDRHTSSTVIIQEQYRREFLKLQQHYALLRKEFLLLNCE